MVSDGAPHRPSGSAAGGGYGGHRQVMLWLVLLLAAAPPAAPPAAWKPLIGEYGAPPNVVYILEKDGDLVEVKGESAPVKLDPKAIQVEKDAKGLVTQLTIGSTILPRHRLPAEDG